VSLHKVLEQKFKISIEDKIVNANLQCLFGLKMNVLIFYSHSQAAAMHTSGYF